MRISATRLRLAAPLIACLALASAGCSIFARRPVLPPMPPEQIVQTLRERAREFSSVVDKSISLKIITTVDGKVHRSPSLGGFIAFDCRLPGLWLNTEKVGHEIFDLKARGMDFSLLLPSSGEIVTGGPRAYAKLPYLIRPDEVQTMFAGPDALGLTWPSTTMEANSDGDTYRVLVFGALFRTVLVDPGTADILRIREYDVLGRAITDITLSGYEAFGSLRFPTRLSVDRPLDGVRVDLRLGDPEVNKPIPPQAFQPHQVPEYRHVDLDRQPLSDVHAFSDEQ